MRRNASTVWPRTWDFSCDFRDWSLRSFGFAMFPDFISSDMIDTGI